MISRSANKETLLGFSDAQHFGVPLETLKCASADAAQNPIFCNCSCVNNSNYGRGSEEHSNLGVNAYTYFYLSINQG